VDDLAGTQAEPPGRDLTEAVLAGVQIDGAARAGNMACFIEQQIERVFEQARIGLDLSLRASSSLEAWTLRPGARRA